MSGVKRADLPKWVSSMLSDGELKLEGRERWRNVVMHPESGLTSTETLTAVGIARFYNQAKGIAFPSMTTLAGATKLSRPTVARALRRLEDAGWIRRESTGLRKVNRYRLEYPTNDPRLGAQDTQPDEAQVGAQDTPLGAHGTQVGAQDTLSRCTVHPEVSTEGLNQGSNKAGAALTGTPPHPKPPPLTPEARTHADNLIGRGWHPEDAEDYARDQAATS